MASRPGSSPVGGSGSRSRSRIVPSSSLNSAPKVTLCGSPVHRWRKRTVWPGCTTTVSGKKSIIDAGNSSWEWSTPITAVGPPPPQAANPAEATSTATASRPERPTRLRIERDGVEGGRLGLGRRPPVGGADQEHGDDDEQQRHP